MAGLTKAELEKQLNSERASRMRAENDLIDFKQKVREKAIEVANEQGWCREGLNDTLESLDLERFEKHVSFKVTVSMDFNAVIDDDEYTGTNTEDYLRDKLANMEVSVSSWYDSNEFEITDLTVQRVTDVVSRDQE